MAVSALRIRGLWEDEMFARQNVSPRGVFELQISTTDRTHALRG